MEKPYNLEERTFLFAKDSRIYVNKLPKNISNIEDIKQLVRSSGSVGANYIEANEKLGEKDFLFRIKIARKEAKEAKYWLLLLHEMNDEFSQLSTELINEAEALRKILSTIISKSSS